MKSVASKLNTKFNEPDDTPALNLKKSLADRHSNLICNTREGLDESIRQIEKRKADYETKYKVKLFALIQSSERATEKIAEVKKMLQKREEVEAQKSEGDRDGRQGI